MSDLDLGRAARLLATALLAAFVLEVVASGVQLAIGVDGFGSRVGVIYAASSVRPASVLLLVTGLIVLALRPDRLLLGAYAAAAFVAVVIAVIGLVLLPGMHEPLLLAQGWNYGGSLVAGGLLAATVAVLALRVRAGATASEPRPWSN